VISRRRLILAAGAAAALPGGSWGRAAESGAPAAAPAAAALYRRAFVLDCNALASVGGMFDGEKAAGDLEALRDAGISAVKCTLGGYNGNFEETVADIAAAEALIERHPDIFIKVSAFEDLDRAKRERRMALIYSFEGVAMLEDRLDRIGLFRQLGVRAMQLSYNHESPFGHGCLDGDDGGLTELGHQAVAKMNERGIAVDVSHSNTRTTAQAIAASVRPPLMTHAGCRAVNPHPRNKEDRDMRALVEKVLGLNFRRAFKEIWSA
jgi:membrane dipeptidase